MAGELCEIQHQDQTEESKDETDEQGLCLSIAQMGGRVTHLKGLTLGSTLKELQERVSEEFGVPVPEEKLLMGTTAVPLADPGATLEALGITGAQDLSLVVVQWPPRSKFKGKYHESIRGGLVSLEVTVYADLRDWNNASVSVGYEEAEAEGSSWAGRKHYEGKLLHLHGSESVPDGMEFVLENARREDDFQVRGVAGGAQEIVLCVQIGRCTYFEGESVWVTVHEKPGRDFHRERPLPRMLQRGSDDSEDDDEEEEQEKAEQEQEQEEEKKHNRRRRHGPHPMWHMLSRP